MMMMDMGMYGTYGKPDSYPNYGFAGGHHHQTSVSHHHHHHHHQSVGHVSVSPSPELAATATHYYSQSPAAIAPYTSTTSSENFIPDTNSATSSNTPPQSFYSASGAPLLHEDGTAIISTENGLSYTNLDYVSVSSSPTSFASHGSCDHHQSYQQQPQQHIQPVYRAEEHRHHHPASLHHQVGTIHRQDHQDLPQQRQQQQQHHQSSHDSSEYQITPSYLHQIPVNEDTLQQQQQHYNQSASVRQDGYPGPQQQHFKEEVPDHVVYHNIQPSSVHGVHPHVHPQHHHHHHQQHHHHSTQQPRHLSQQQQQQQTVPTYKWMQVKRNVPKPAGEFELSSREIGWCFILRVRSDATDTLSGLGILLTEKKVSRYLTPPSHVESVYEK